MRDLLRDDSRTAIMSTINLSEATGALLQQYGPEAADEQERVLRELVAYVKEPLHHPLGQRPPAPDLGLL